MLITYLIIAVLALILVGYACYQDDATNSEVQLAAGYALAWPITLPIFIGALIAAILADD
jgi:uncharacterized oligopeptide transporter (OPT) family protein